MKKSYWIGAVLLVALIIGVWQFNKPADNISNAPKAEAVEAVVGNSPKSPAERAIEGSENLKPEEKNEIRKNWQLAMAEVNKNGLGCKLNVNSTIEIGGRK